MTTWLMIIRRLVLLMVACAVAAGVIVWFAASFAPYVLDLGYVLGAVFFAALGAAIGIWALMEDGSD